MDKEKEKWDSKFEMLADDHEDKKLANENKANGDDASLVLENGEISKDNFLSFMECVWPTVAHYYFEVEREISASIQRANQNQVQHVTKKSQGKPQSKNQNKNENDKENSKDKENQESQQPSNNNKKDGSDFPLNPLNTCSQLETYCFDCSKVGKKGSKKVEKSKAIIVSKSKSKSKEVQKVDSTKKIVQIEDTSGNITWDVVETEIVPSVSVLVEKNLSAIPTCLSTTNTSSSGSNNNNNNHYLRIEDSVPILTNGETNNAGLHLYTDSPDSIPPFVRQALTDADTQIRQALSTCFSKVSKSFTTSYPRIRLVVNKSYQQIIHTIKCAYPNIKYSTQNSYDKVQGTVKSSYPKIRKVVNHSYLKRPTLSSCYRKFRQIYTSSHHHHHHTNNNNNIHHNYNHHHHHSSNSGTIGSQNQNHSQTSAQLSKALTDANFDVSQRLSGANAEISQSLHNASKKVSIALGTANLEVLQSLKSASNKVSKALVKANSEVLEALASANDDLQKSLTLAQNEVLRSLESIKKELFKTLFDLHPSVLRKILFAFEDLMKELDKANLEMLETLAKASSSVCEQISIAHAQYSEAKVNVNYELSLHLAKANSQLLQVLITANSKVTDVLERNSEKVNQITCHFKSQFGLNNNNNNTNNNNTSSNNNNNGTTTTTSGALLLLHPTNPEALEQKVWKVIEKGEPEIWKSSENASFTIEAAVESTDSRLWKIADEADNTLRKTVEVVEQKLWSSIGASEWKLKNCAERLEARLADVVSHLIETAWSSVTTYVQENYGRQLFKEFCKQHQQEKSKYEQDNNNNNQYHHHHHHHFHQQHQRLHPDFEMKLPEIEGRGSVQVLVCYNNEYYVGFPDDSEEEEGFDKSILLHRRSSELDLCYKREDFNNNNNNKCIEQKMIDMVEKSKSTTLKSDQAQSEMQLTHLKALEEKNSPEKSKSEKDDIIINADNMESEDEDGEFAKTLTACCGSLDLVADQRMQSLASAQAREVLSQHDKVETLEKQFKHLLEESQNLEKTLETELTQQPTSLRAKVSKSPKRQKYKYLDKNDGETEKEKKSKRVILKSGSTSIIREKTLKNSDKHENFFETAEILASKHSNNNNNANQNNVTENIPRNKANEENILSTTASLPSSQINPIGQNKEKELDVSKSNEKLEEYKTEKQNDDFIEISGCGEFPKMYEVDMTAVTPSSIDELDLNKNSTNNNNGIIFSDPDHISSLNIFLRAKLPPASTNSPSGTLLNLSSQISECSTEQSQSNSNSNVMPSIEELSIIFRQNLQKIQDSLSKRNCKKPREKNEAGEQVGVEVEDYENSDLSKLETFQLIEECHKAWNIITSTHQKSSNMTSFVHSENPNPTSNLQSLPYFRKRGEEEKEVADTNFWMNGNWLQSFPLQQQQQQQWNSPEYVIYNNNNSVGGFPYNNLNPAQILHINNDSNELQIGQKKQNPMAFSYQLPNLKPDESDPIFANIEWESVCAGDKNNEDIPPSCPMTAFCSHDLTGDQKLHSNYYSFYTDPLQESWAEEASDEDNNNDKITRLDSADQDETSTQSSSSTEIEIGIDGKKSKSKIEPHDVTPAFSSESCTTETDTIHIEESDIKSSKNPDENDEKEQQSRIIDTKELDVSELTPIILEMDSLTDVQKTKDSSTKLSDLTSVQIEEMENSPSDTLKKAEKVKRSLSNVMEVGHIMLSEFSRKLQEQNCTIEFQDNDKESSSSSNSDTLPILPKSKQAKNKYRNKIKGSKNNQEECLSYLNVRKISVQNLSDSSDTHIEKEQIKQVDSPENLHMEEKGRFQKTKRSISKLRRIFIPPIVLGSIIRNKMRRRGKDGVVNYHCCPFPFSSVRKCWTCERRETEKRRERRYNKIHSISSSCSSIRMIKGVQNQLSIPGKPSNSCRKIKHRVGQQLNNNNNEEVPWHSKSRSLPPSLSQSSMRLSSSNNINNNNSKSNYSIEKLKQNPNVVKKTMNKVVLSHHINLKSR